MVEFQQVKDSADAVVHCTHKLGTVRINYSSRVPAVSS